MHLSVIYGHAADVKKASSAWAQLVITPDASYPQIFSRAWTWHTEITAVKRAGLLRSNVLGKLWEIFYFGCMRLFALF